MTGILPEDFASLVNLAMKEPGRSAMRQVIEKELLHFDILFALEREGLLEKMTFQGGTCLRLCAGSPRFSEDLDFAGGGSFSDRDAALLKVKDAQQLLGIPYRFHFKMTQAVPENSRLAPIFHLNMT